MDLPISEEPNFGKWKITAVENLNREAAATATFEVKKYVLPKFEAKLNAPKNVMLDQIDFNVTACAKYSFTDFSLKYSQILIKILVTPKILLRKRCQRQNTVDWSTGSFIL